MHVLFILYNGYRESFPFGGKARLRRDAEHSPYLAPRSWMSRSYTSCHPMRLHMCIVVLLLSSSIQWQSIETMLYVMCHTR
jgi:hypothetical protein